MSNDLPISGLTTTGNASGNDKFIVNSGQDLASQTTRAITFSDLASSLGASGDVAMSPIFITFGGNWDGTDGAYENIGSQDDLFGAGLVVKVQMPATADSAIVINTYGSAIKASQFVKAGSTTNAMAQFQYYVTLSGGSAEWALAPGGEPRVTMAMGTAYHMPAPYAYGVTDSYVSKTDSSRSNRISFTKGSEVTFTANADLRRAKKCIPAVGGGRMVILPFDSTNARALAAANDLVDTEGVVYGTSKNALDSEIFPPLTPTEEQQSLSQDAKHNTVYVINGITNAIDYNTAQITSQFPGSSYPDPTNGGAGTDILTLLRNIRAALGSLQSDGSLDTKEKFSQRYNDLVYGNENNSIPGAAAYVSFQFAFETFTPPSGYGLGAGF